MDPSLREKDWLWGPSQTGRDQIRVGPVGGWFLLCFVFRSTVRIVVRLLDSDPGRSWAVSAVSVMQLATREDLCHVASSGCISMVWRATANSELARTRGIRLSN